ncbi:MAG: hypothetical protein H0X16_04360 [Chloroflexi bacterium]|nr:hypothetical protein [Chloroflexota bacterium]
MRLRDDIVLGDGGYVLELEKRGYVQAGPFTLEVNKAPEDPRPRRCRADFQNCATHRHRALE